MIRTQLLLAVLIVGLCSYSAQALGVSPTCVGDCDGNGRVSVDEVITMVNIALGTATSSSCVAGDGNLDGRLTIDEIIAAVNNVLNECVGAAIRLAATIDFAASREPINRQLMGTGGAAPVAELDQFLQVAFQPPFMRIDVGFEDVGCPDDPEVGALYNPSDNSFNYCQLDERLAHARAAGASVLLIIDYTPLALVAPACAASNGRGLGVQHCPPADQVKYGALIEAMIRHVYARYGVTDFEVWNEPDGVYFAGRLADYLQLYNTANSAMLRAETALGLPARTLRLGGPAAMVARQSWITALLAAAVADPNLRLDFISWHNYANKVFGSSPDPSLYAGTYADDTATVRGWLAPFLVQRPDLEPQLWIDEWNVNAFFDHRMDTSYAAAFAAASMHGMQDAGLDRAARFNTWDSSPADPVLFTGNWGLFTYDGRVRPALHAFALWRQMASTRVHVQLVDTDSMEREASIRTRYNQNLLGSVDPLSGRGTILLYNFVPYGTLSAAPPYCGGGPDLHAELELHGLPDGTYQVVQQQIDCRTAIQPIADAALAPLLSTLMVADGAGSLAVDVPPDGVLQLTLSR